MDGRDEGAKSGHKRKFCALSRAFTPSHPGSHLLQLLGKADWKSECFFIFFFTEEGRHGAVEWLLGGTKLRELKSDHYLTMEGKMRKTKTNKSVRTLEDCRLKNSQLFYQ